MELNHKKIEEAVNQASRKIVQSILVDMAGRNGLSDEWGQIDRELQAEIRAEWRSLTRVVLAEFGADLLKEVLDPIQGAIDEELDGEPSRRKREELALAGVGGPPDAEGL